MKIYNKSETQVYTFNYYQYNININKFLSIL